MIVAAGTINHLADCADLIAYSAYSFASDLDQLTAFKRKQGLLGFGIELAK